MIDYIYVTPKIITATIIFTLIQSSTIKDPILQSGIFAILYYLTGTYGLGYEMNWKEIMMATLICSVLVHSKLKLPAKMIAMISLLAITRPLCYIS